MWRNHKKLLIITLSALIILLGVGVAFLLYQSHAKRNTPEAKSIRLFQSLSKQISLPLYKTRNAEKYSLTLARAEDGAIVLSTYRSAKGIISVTQQPKPAEDPFGNIKPVATFVSDIGEGRLFPDDEKNPYIIVSTTRSWVIVRSTSSSITSDDLKAFCITLREVRTDEDS